MWARPLFMFLSGASRSLCGVWRGFAPLFVSGVREKEHGMKKPSEYNPMKHGFTGHDEINSTTPVEKTIVVIVIFILFWIFVVVTQEKQMQDATSSQAYQTKGEEQ